MYTDFYGLREKPFSLSPDPRFLFFADAHREALAHLRYGLSQDEGFMAITGEVGTGKTTICRTLLQRLGDETEVAFLFNPARSSTELLQSIALEFGLEPAGRQRHALNDQLNRFLLEKKAEGHRVLLIIDEAQNLDEGVLEEVRLLSNLETESSKLIQILLLGQPELDRKLDSDDLRQLRQRISVRWHLEPLLVKETADYVKHRLDVAAGAERSIFSTGALRDIHHVTAGIPRRINLLCDRALLAGYAAGQHRIGKRFLRQVTRELERSNRGVLEQRRWPFFGRLALATGVFAVAALVGLGIGYRDSLPSLYDSIRNGEARSAGAIISQLLPPFPAEGLGVDASLTDPQEEPVVIDAEAVLRGEDPIEVNRVSIPMTSSVVSGVALEFDPTVAVARFEGPMGTRSERVFNTLAPGSYLGRLLDHHDEGLARLIAGNAILDAYQLSNYLDSPESEEELIGWLEQRGLAALELYGADLETLRILNHPALLVMNTELGGLRIAAIERMSEETALLHGVAEVGGIEVPIREIESQWTGDGYVIWEAFEPIPDLLMLGQSGRGVAWLQASLAELGFYDGDVTGDFDRSTQRGVIALQSSSAIEADGAVGPQTQMILYDLLDRYQVPRLASEEGEG